MCGILGQINYDNSNHHHLHLSSLNHRGPDGSGEWTNNAKNVYLGHTRLAILDPTPAGQQPMIDHSKRFTIAFNGEIYNHVELRRLMPDISWRGNSDTETLLELFALKGLDALPLLKGMFAFAVYDDAEKVIYIVRDRVGIKPIWYRINDNSCSFSSELIPLLEEGEIAPSKVALSEYIAFGRMPGSGELYDRLQQVKPGEWVKLKANGQVEKGQWWPDSSSFQFPTRKRRNEYVERVNNLVTQAVHEHLISDVGVGAFLSGGIDSSIITLIAARELGKNLRTFTVGFPNKQKQYDERSIAAKVAKKAGAEHFEIEVTEEACLKWVKQAVTSLDVPSVDAINTFIVSKAVRDMGLKVALSGLGGDELFAGYPSFKTVPILNSLNLLPNNLINNIVKLTPSNIQEKLGGLKSFNAIDLAVARRRFCSVEKLREMGLSAGIPLIPPAPANLDTMAKISWGELFGYTVPMLLRDSDQMSMAAGLEIRVPFLDHVLIEEVLCIPEKFKKGKGVKPLLVDAFKSILPEEVYNKPKQGFSLPMADWIKGPLEAFTDEGLSAVAAILHLTEPLSLKSKFLNSSLHWTRIWNWSVLGHWLIRRNEVKIYEPAPAI
ncbi:MAG: asparagine synthase, glutamine-hydrolyzing [Segetibacter sp.]|nr:asparagine synthase, glutamine-hydrolyzing [Segetibacter sp.]